MPYAYYDKLSARDKATYRESDRIIRVPLKAAASMWPLVEQIRAALEEANRSEVQAYVQRLVTRMVTDLGAPPVHVKVLAARPSHDWGEMQGLYEPEDDDVAVITVWMRTAAKKRVVAFKTFLRTVLHEICHHLDYELYGLEESFHTEGFFKRESSLFHQIVGRDAQVATPPAAQA
ncbi:MAG: hypothetical protein AMS18_16680 [Gemmatimonas sp. SG8_17]|nr:MAG: hypothetical protein AMS18_16680 [Gemmatimonas sp. SG8_17]